MSVKSISKTHTQPALKQGLYDGKLTYTDLPVWLELNESVMKVYFPDTW